MLVPICLRLFVHTIRNAFALAMLSAGSNNAARMAMIAMTTSNSISVNAVSVSEESLPGICPIDSAPARICIMMLELLLQSSLLLLIPVALDNVSQEDAVGVVG